MSATRLQTSAMLGLSCMPVSGLTLGVDFNYYGRHYADFAAADRTDEKRQGGSLEAPDYSTVDLNLNYDFKMGTFRGSFSAT